MGKRNTIFSQGGQFRVGEELFYFALGGTYPVTDYVMSMCLRRIPNSFYIQFVLTIAIIMMMMNYICLTLSAKSDMSINGQSKKIYACTNTEKWIFLVFFCI